MPPGSHFFSVSRDGNAWTRTGHAWSTRRFALSVRPGFDTFASLAGLRFEPFGHQLAAASTVLRTLRGRAILANEVGRVGSSHAPPNVLPIRLARTGQEGFGVVKAGSP